MALATRNRMRRFWDRRAEEDAFYFVDNRLRYGRPDLERFWSEGEKDLDHLLSALGLEIKEGDVVVDLGCGVGRLTRAIARRAREVRAIDVSERMLELARRHNPDLANAHWLLGDGVSLEPIPDGSIDACVSHVVFQHIPDPSVTLGYVREMARVLRPGGWAAFQVSNDPAVHRRPAITARLLQLVHALRGRAPRGQTDPAWLGAAIDLNELQRVALAAGLAIERLVGQGTQFCLVRARRLG